MTTTSTEVRPMTSTLTEHAPAVDPVAAEVRAPLAGHQAHAGARRGGRGRAVTATLTQPEQVVDLVAAEVRAPLAGHQAHTALDAVAEPPRAVGLVGAEVRVPLAGLEVEP